MNHGLGPDDSERVCTAKNEEIQPNEHRSVEGPENKSPRGIAPQYIELLPENEDFRLKPPSRAKQAVKRSPQQHQNIDHRA